MVAGRAVGELRLEAAPLLRRIVQLAEGIGDLEAADVQLEPLHRVRVVRLLLRERRHLGREVVDEGRLDEVVLVQPLEDLGGDLAGAPPRLHLETELRGEPAAASRLRRSASVTSVPERADAASRAPSRSETRR